MTLCNNYFTTYLDISEQRNQLCCHAIVESKYMYNTTCMYVSPCDNNKVGLFLPEAIH